MIRGACAGLLAGLTATPAMAVDEGPGVWGAVFFSDTLDGALPNGQGPRLWMDLHLRQRPPTADGGVGSFLAIVRPGVGFQFASWLALDTGYAWLPVVAADNSTRGAEHRWWTHLLIGGKAGRVFVQFRPRFELRFDGNRPQVGARVRTFGRVNVDVAGPVYVPVWDEAFWQTNTYGALEPGLDENRAFVGVGMRGSSWLGVELGYMNRWIPARSNAGSARMQHTALFVVSLRPDIRLR